MIHYSMWMEFHWIFDMCMLVNFTKKIIFTTINIQNLKKSNTSIPRAKELLQHKQWLWFYHKVISNDWCMYTNDRHKHKTYTKLNSTHSWSRKSIVSLYFEALALMSQDWNEAEKSFCSHSRKQLVSCALKTLRN